MKEKQSKGVNIAQKQLNKLEENNAIPLTIVNRSMSSSVIIFLSNKLTKNTVIQNDSKKQFIKRKNWK
jgi:hypothetical protein